MADGFDSEEILYNIIEDCGVMVYKGPAPTNKSGEHIVVRSIVTSNLPDVNVVPVAVNIYKPKTGNGMIDRTWFKAIRATIYSLVEAAASPSGYYCVIDRIFSQFIEDGKDGFDCFSIRYELTLNQ